MKEAIQVFFQQDAPPLVVLALMGLVVQRCSLGPLSWADPILVLLSAAFWCVQEHVMHQKLLHSDWDWYGKRIHQEHHLKDYHHISVDPAWMVLSWLGAVYWILQQVLPLPLAVSTTFGYALAGFGYVWWHYIVHTKVRFPKGSYAARVQANHARHHLVDDRYWLAFSWTGVDDLLGTNPSLRDVRQQRAMTGRG